MDGRDPGVRLFPFAACGGRPINSLSAGDGREVAFCHPQWPDAYHISIVAMGSRPIGPEATAIPVNNSAQFRDNFGGCDGSGGTGWIRKKVAENEKDDEDAITRWKRRELPQQRPNEYPYSRAASLGYLPRRNKAVLLPPNPLLQKTWK